MGTIINHADITTEPRKYQGPWIREINYAVATWGHLAKAYLATEGRDGLRNKILIKLLEVALTNGHVQAARDKTDADAKRDPYVIQIAKNCIRYLGDSKTGFEWIYNEVDGQQERRRRRVKEVALYDATAISNGKPKPLVRYRKSGSETGNAAYTSHNTIPEGEDNLEDKCLPDIDGAIDSAVRVNQLAYVYLQLKPAHQQTVLLAKIYRHPKAERPDLLAKFGLKPRLGLSEKGWDKRWARTKAEINRLIEECRASKKTNAGRVKSRFQFSQFRLAWFEAYASSLANDTLRKFGDASPELKQLLVDHPPLDVNGLIAKADEIKAKHAKGDLHAGRAMTVYWASQKTNYATMRTKAIRRKDGRAIVQVYGPRTAVDIYLERENGLSNFRQAGFEQPDLQYVAPKKSRYPKKPTERLSDTPYKSPWILVIPAGRVIPVGVPHIAYGPKLRYLKCRVCDRYGVTKIAAPELLPNQEIEIKRLFPLVGVGDFGPPAEVWYVCRDCCRMPFSHFVCANRSPTTVRKLINLKWERVLGTVRCRARRVVGCIYCFNHLRSHLKPSFGPPPSLDEVVDMRVLDWMYGDFNPRPVISAVKRRADREFDEFIKKNLTST